MRNPYFDLKYLILTVMLTDVFLFQSPSMLSLRGPEFDVSIYFRIPT